MKIMDYKSSKARNGLNFNNRGPLPTERCKTPDFQPRRWLNFICGYSTTSWLSFCLCIIRGLTPTVIEIVPLRGDSFLIFNSPDLKN